ncbi:hypothetical protein COCCADRAFT_22626 [Bipolaris zeicola 26-R-13]|uniref:Uncharacterized protein n=1 Tax=Cochliobolus carbonum (strain 26-R-13) TaxID=930089 RepID=W6YJN4_COCC2|nr:uncharacterized protein COCCADRAFT_22626 [Bipolaris zeicola 26-R-13]EUC37873.1 hypothetical protein COCCADRAFT_22626 [Bipolaris zeicola 26-R-13]
MERVRKICTLCKIERQFEHSTRRDTSCPLPRPSRGYTNSRAQKGRKVFTHDTTRTSAPLKKRNTLRLQSTAKDRSTTRQPNKEDTGVEKPAWLRTWLNKLPITTCPKPPTSSPSSISPPPRKANSVDLSRMMPFHREEETPTALPRNTPTAPVPHCTRTRTRIAPATRSSSTPNLTRHFSLSKKPSVHQKPTPKPTTPSMTTKLQKRAPTAPLRPKSTTTTTTSLFPPRPTSTILRPSATPAPDSNPTTKRPQTHSPDPHPDPSKGAVAGDRRNSTAYLTITTTATGDEDEDGEFEMSETRRLLWEYWNVQCRFLAEEWIDE